MFEVEDLIRCVDCKACQPKTETHYTLISSRYGWRLTRTVTPAGQRILEWRCPECWASHRERAKQTAKQNSRIRFGT